MTQARTASSAIVAPGRHGVWIAFAVLFLIALLPVLIVRIAALEDYPQHLARVYILGNLDRSPVLQRYYAPNWVFQPNLAIETVLLPVTKFIGIEPAGKFFLALLLFSLAGGTVALHRAIHGRWSLWPLLAFFLLYNRILLGGMVNYLFTLGLSLWAAAAWIHLRDRPPLIRTIVSIPVALALLLGHMAAFGVYALFVAGYEISRHLETARKWHAVSPADVLAAGSQFAVAAAVLLTFSSASGVIAKYSFAFLEKFDAPLNLFYNYHLVFDAATFLGFVLLLAIGLAAGWVIVNRRLILCIVLLVLAFVAMPYGMASAIGADRRLTLAIALVIVAATDWRPVAMRWRTALLAGLAGLFIVRMAIIADTWRASDRVYEQYLAAFERLPQGDRLAVAIAHNSTQTTTNPPLNGIGQYAIIRRDAFVNNTFTLPGQQPLSFTPRYAALSRQLPITVFDPDDLRRLRDRPLPPGRDPFSCARLSGYDNLLVIHEADFPLRLPGWLAPVAEGTDFRLYRIGSCAQP